MPSVDLEEEEQPQTTADDAPAGDTSTADTSDEDAPAGNDDGAAADPLTDGLEDLDEIPVVTQEVETAPAGVTVDDKGRWRDKDGKFFAKQPNAEAAKSARDERAQLERVASYKAQGLDERGNREWKPNIYGTEKTVVPGALHKPGTGLFVPEKALGQLTALVARGEKYHEVQASRQEQAQVIAREQERTEFYSNKFTEIVTETLLNPEWFAWAGQDAKTFETATMQVQAKLRAAALDAKEKFGAIAPKADAPATTGDRLDQYDAQNEINDYLDELMADAEFAGMDKASVIAEIRRENPTLFHQNKEHGWLLDTRPVRIIAKNVVLSRRSATPAVDPAKARNAAAVPTKPVAKKLAPPARRSANTTPIDPKTDPRFEGKQRYNKALTLEERREAFYRENNMRVPG